jgi:organic radical activating enzyme
MSKIKISEIFGPAGYWNYNVTEGGFDNQFVERWGVTQGEGQYVGIRSVFLRTFGCNLRCPSFGLDHGEKTTEPAEFAKNIHLYNNISETPAAQYGCDSYFSVYPEFKSLSPSINTQEIAAMILKASGGSLLDNYASPIHLILTGGEPMLPGWQKTYQELIDHIYRLDPGSGIMKVTVETNGTQPLIKDFREGNLFLPDVDLTWSISPKLSVSGHTAEEAICPEVIASYLEQSNDLYLKFVVVSPADFDEVDRTVKSIEEACGTRLKVYIMPEGGTVGEYQKHSTLDLVGEAVKRGYNITPRLQVMIGANVTGW